MPFVGRYRRIGNGIGNAKVHGRETRRGGISKITDLHGCGTPRENYQPVGRSVSREIDENVDPVGTHQLDQCIVGQPPDIAPRIGICTQARGHPVLKVRIAVQHICKCAAIAGAQDRLEEVRHGVGSKIARDESNAQCFRSVGAGAHAVGDRRRVFEGKARTPLADSRSDLLGTDPIRTVQRHDMTGLRLKIRGIEAASGAQLRDGRIDVSAR